MLKGVFSLFLFFLSTCQADGFYQLAICAIFQDEAPYLKEWIEFHRLMGVEHFYLYNHASTDNYKEVLKPYLLSGVVELKDEFATAKDICSFNALQCKCYTKCLKEAREKANWVAFLDIDEYLFPVKGEKLPEFLKEYEKFGGVGVNWRVFGTSHVWKIPSHQLLIEALTFCTEENFPLNKVIKYIIRPECASHFERPHVPIFYSPYFAVNTDKLPVEGVRSTYTQLNKLRINHYWTRDGNYFYSQKVPRQKRWGGNPVPSQIIPKLNSQQDSLILQFAPMLRSNMG